MKALLLARFTLREAVRKKAVLGTAILTIVFLLLYGIGLYLAYHELRVPQSVKRSVDSELLLAGLYFVNFIGGLLAIFSAVGTISTEIEQGTLHSVVPKPVQRWEIVLGKTLGFAVMLTGYVVITGLATIAIVYFQSGYLSGNLLIGMLVMVLGPLLLLGLTMLGTCLLSTVANGIVIFMLYALALAAGKLEQLGTVVRNQTLIDIGVTTSLVIPSDALWRKASSLLGAGGFLNAAGASQPGLFSVTDAPSDWMIAYAVIYMIVAVALAVAIFQRRDL